MRPSVLFRSVPVLDIKWVCQNPEFVRQGLSDKGNEGVDLDQIIALNDKRRSLQHKCDELKREKKEVAASFQATAKAGGELGPLKERSQSIKAEEKEIGTRLGEVKSALDAVALVLPNLPHPDAPRGGESQNAIRKVVGEALELPFQGKDHIALGEALGILDVRDQGVKVAGSGFALFRGQGARLVRALINFFLDVHTIEHGYTEICPPLLVNRKTMTGTGQLPKFEDDLYHCGRDDLFLIPTAEVPVTNLHAGEILDYKALPVCYTAYTPCFRREAGSYGKDTRGLMRLHQFDKVEMVRLCHPDQSESEHQLLLSHAEELLQRLGLHYRVLELATADTSFSAARCFDLEVWAPVTKRWFEVSSVSTFTDFQARRASIRFRDEDRKVRFVHSLNGSGLALPRIILCILEQYQQQDGSISLPEPLRPFMGKDVIAP